jgi:GT2 family glycosyltransferase
LTLVADIVRVCLVVSAGAFFAVGDDAGGLKAVLVLAPALTGRLARVAPAFDLLFTLALAAEAIGSGLGALDPIGWGDTESHLVIPFLSAPILYQVLVRLSAIPPLDVAPVAHPWVGAAVVTCIGVLALGALWELVEWGADGAFGTDYSEGYVDTLSDLLADAIAAAAGGVLVALWLSSKTSRGNEVGAPPPSRAGPDASVVIPTHGRRQGIERVVRAALEDEATREVIVVVDGSDDGTYECLLDVAEREPRLRPVWQDNAGQIAALQKGVEEARYPVVVMLDDDVVAEPGLVTGHAKRHSAGRRQVVLGYIPVEEQSTWPDRVTARLYSMGYEHQCRRWEADPREVISLLWAGNMSVRRSDALEVGLDNPDCRLGYLQDRELGLRLMKAGFSAVFDRSLRASHLYSRSLEDFRRDAKRSGQGRWRLHEVHGDILGPVPPNPFEGGPWAPRVVLRLGAGPAGPAVAAVLAGAAYALGRLGATRTSARHYGLLWGVLERREYIAEGHRRRHA